MFIVGIEPRAPGLHIFSKFELPRLGLPLLLTIAQQMGHQCLIFCEDITPIQWDIVRKADLVLLSTITPTAPRAYELIKEIKVKNPRAPVLIGGSHVTFLPKEALNKGADYVFRHEADQSFPQFLEWFTSPSRNFEELFKILGLSFMVGDQFQHNPDPALVDLDKLPTPDLDLVYGYKLGTIPLNTSRGCPYNCEICCVVRMFGRKFRFRSEEKVIKDIKYYKEKYGNKADIFFTDDNFGANRLRLRRLCQAIIEKRLIGKYSAQVRLDLAKHPEDIALIGRMGIRYVYIGYESINPKSLEEMDKRLNPDEMEGYTKVFHDNNIMIHGMWVFGFVHDILKTIKDTVRVCIKWRIETNQFLILVPYPGTPVYVRLKREKRIFNWDWSEYDAHHVTFEPDNMTARQLQIAVMLQAMPKLYNFWQTTKIFVVNNWKIGMGFLRRSNWHPIREIKRNISTLRVRLWAKYATWRMKKPVKEYLQKIVPLMKKAR